ncbi:MULTISPECIES: hypothetical protein [unclassified Streptomyces]|uniref:hypothetical protein n=1 Tax=unclassified Streptomyces TaxID=2593676 RepID=UPI00278C2A82|nr:MULTISPECIES: hypothetical protein [unclassified Streptomyces]
MSLSASFHPTADTTIRCHTYGIDHAPILALDDSGQVLCVSLFDSMSTADHRAFTRDLVNAVTEYAAAVEEWATAQDTPAIGTLTKAS